MSARIDIKGKTYTNIYVQEFAYSKNTHAYWKVKCLLCDKTFYATYTNLNSGNTTACAGCNVIGLDRKTRDEIVQRKANKESIVSIAKHYEISRSKVYSILKKMSSKGNAKAGLNLYPSRETQKLS